MAEYIDREALKNDIAKSTEPFNTGSVFRAIDRQIAADVAPVVRCKDCKFSHADGHGRTCEGYWFELSEYAVSVKDDAFYSSGERRDKP